jgi:hypothetical protein
MSQMGHVLLSTALVGLTYEFFLMKYFVKKDDWEFMQSQIVGRLLGYALFLIILFCVLK